MLSQSPNIVLAVRQDHDQTTRMLMPTCTFSFAVHQMTSRDVFMICNAIGKQCLIITVDSKEFKMTFSSNIQINTDLIFFREKQIISPLYEKYLI